MSDTLLIIEDNEQDFYMMSFLLKNNSFKVIGAVTSYAMAGDRERILAAGATGYIEKPIDPETFLAEIIQYLSKDLGDRGRRL